MIRYPSAALSLRSPIVAGPCGLRLRRAAAARQRPAPLPLVAAEQRLRPLPRRADPTPARAIPAKLSTRRSNDQVQAIRGLDAEDAGHAEDRSTRRAAEDARRALHQRQPAGAGRGERALYKALGLMPKRSRPRVSSTSTSSRARSRASIDPKTKSLYVVSQGRADRRRREGHVLPRVRPRAAGPALSISTRSRTGSSTRPTRCWPARRCTRATPTLLMTQWAAAATSSPAEIPEVLAASQRSGGAGGARSRSPQILRRQLAVPVHAGLTFVSAMQSDGGWHGRRRHLRQAARSRPSRSSTPRSTRPARRRSRSTLPADLATKLGTGWSRAARGHVRRVPDRRSGCARSASPPRRPRRRGGLGRRPARGAERPGRRLGGRLADGLGHATPTRPSSRPRRPRRSPRPAAPARCSRARAARPAGSSSAATTPTLGKVAERPGPRRLSPAPRAARYIDSGAEIPSRPSALAQRDLRRSSEREARRRPLGLVRVDDPRVAVEGVERRRELGRVGGDALRLLGRDRVLDDLGKPDDRPGQRRLGRIRRACPRRRPPAPARRRRPCAGSTRSGRARTGRSRRGSRSTASWPARCRSRCAVVAAREAKNQRAASTPTSASSSSSVMNSPARLLIEISCAVADEADPRVEQDLDGLAVVAHRLRGVADAGDRPVVVGAPDVDEVVEAAAELLGDVADVGREVRRLAVRTG